MRNYFWQTIIILLSIGNLIFLTISSHMVEKLNYQELLVELIRLPVWLFIMFYASHLRHMPTVYPLLLSGSIFMYLGNGLNANDEIFQLDNFAVSLTEDAFLSLGVIFCVMGFYKLISQIVEQTSLLNELASKDLLICLADRRSFFQEMRQERRVKGVKTNCYMLIDIDNFHYFTNKYGRACGDYLLIKLAKMIGGLIRKQDHVCHRGGNEFLIELGQVSKQNAKAKANQIQTLMSDNYFNFAAESLDVSISIGISEYDTETGNKNDAIRDAEESLLIEQEKKLTNQ